jgi:predicted lipoprotein with Yx(FWY)xxD motif
MAQTAIGIGESTTMSVLVFDADGQDLTYTWQEDNDLTAEGHSSISTPSAQTVTWTAPDALPGNADGAVYSVYVIVQDEDGNQDWAFDEIWVYANPVETTINRIVADTDSTGGCGATTTTISSSDTASAVLFPIVPLLGMVAWRRRRRD